MATDPNKALLTESQTIEKSQPTYGLNRRTQFAEVYDGQVLGFGTGVGVKLSVEFGQVSGVTAVNAPGAPTSVVATAGDAQASVAFVAPASDGGAPILDYTVTSTPGGITATGQSSPIVVEGLTNDTAYTFKVKARNVVGFGTESSASSAVTPEEPEPEEPEPEGGE
jgi:hypothetical protein